jgi:hypothetical protein
MDAFTEIIESTIRFTFRTMWFIIRGLFGLVFGAFKKPEGPRPSLPPSNLPPTFKGVWRGTVRDNSPNSYKHGYTIILDFDQWVSTTQATGPGHRGATGQLRLVAIRGDEIEVEEDVTGGYSIEHSVDGVYVLRPNATGTELRLKWRGQYPSRDIYVASGTMQRTAGHLTR